jgi:hypothetical protein
VRLLVLLAILAMTVGACSTAPLDARTPDAPAAKPAQFTYPEILDLDASGLRMPGGGGTASIRYHLSQRGLVRLRLVDKSTPGVILLTLLDWAPRDAGPHAEAWDGRDRKGSYPDTFKVSLAVVAEPGREALDESERQALSALRHPEIKHFQHPVELCGDLNVRITNPVDGAASSGMATIEAEITGQPGMPDPEYHVVVYIDGRNAWDGRVTEPRLTVPFDTLNLPDGERLVAVTFNDLHDHAGSDWVTIVVSNR